MRLCAREQGESPYVTYFTAHDDYPGYMGLLILSPDWDTVYYSPTYYPPDGRRFPRGANVVPD